MNLIRKFLRTNASLWVTLPIRISLGIIFIAHGSQKLFGWFGGKGLEATAKFFGDMLGMHPAMFWATLAACGDFFGGVFVLFGLFTRLGAISIAVTMLVAMFKVHLSQGFFLPKGFEYTFALLGMALALLIAGGGAASIDAAISGKVKRNTV